MTNVKQGAKFFIRMFEQYSDEPVFNVKAITRQTGVAAATLRAWERRYGVPSPPRTDSGYRLYSARDVAIIRWLRAQIEGGMSISQAVHLLRSLQAQSPDGQAHTAHARPTESGEPSSYRRLHDEILAAAGEFDEEHIEQVLGEAFSLYPVEEVCLQLIQPVLVTLGERWRLGEVNISVEHFVTNVMRRKLLALMAASPPSTREARVVSGCAPGEYHEIGVLMISLFLRRRGFGVIYLGQNIAAARFHEMLTKTRPNLVLLSASSLVTAANMLEIATELHDRLASDGVIVAFGGRIFNQVPALRRHVPGVYMGDTAREATDRLSELLTGGQSGEAFKVNYTLLPSTTRDLLITLRRHQPEIIAAATRLLGYGADDVTVHAQLVQANEQLMQIVNAALRFGEPFVLGDRSYWAWDALPPDGITGSQLHHCAQALAEAAETILPAEHLAALQPYFQALQGAFLHHSQEHDATERDARDPRHDSP